MDRKIYRVFLVILILAGLAAGFFYYQIDTKKENLSQRGFFVQHIEKNVTIHSHPCMFLWIPSSKLENPQEHTGLIVNSDKKIKQIW